MDSTVDRYLARIGIDPAGVTAPDYETLARLQRAHVTSVPFETLSITGDPYGSDGGEGIELTIPHLYEKVVERERGGYCFELNGLFGWLLARIGFDVDRLAGRVGSDGDFRPPANHHPLLVTLDRPYLVDVGTGIPMIRRPLPIDGRAVTDEVGVDWRVVESDRPDAEYLTQYREPSADEWTDRYVFDTTPRKLSYFEATCDYLATAPESPFTGDPTVMLATDRGHRKLVPGTMTETVHGPGSDEGTHERSVDEDGYHDCLAQAFGLILSDRTT